MNKLTIREANDHLQQLHQRVCELENQVEMKTLRIEELQEANQLLASSVQQKNEELERLAGKLRDSEEQVQRLLSSAMERDETATKLEQKARLFYEAVEHRPSLARILQVLDQVSEAVGVKQHEENLVKENGQQD